MIMIIKQQSLTLFIATTVVVASAGSFLADAQAGGFSFGGQLPGTVTHPSGYIGVGGQLDVKVCIVPSTPNAVAMQQSVQNNIAVWNKLQSTSSNLRSVPLPSGTFDFESVALHELGHCIGLSHPNVGGGSANANHTESNVGPDGVFDFNAGDDGIIGSADDVRDDDINRVYFYPDSNNPFVEKPIVDSSTYTLALGSLPQGDLFAANADRTVSALPRYLAPNTEASMQQGTFNDEIQRTLGHDDVSTLRYGMSGSDSIQGNMNDYTVNLTFGGISDAADCDINIAMDATETGFAVCGINGFFTGNNIRIGTGNIFYNQNIDWYFNNESPCSESVALTPDVWKMISLPCQVGVSTSATLRDVFGDDLGEGTLGTEWAVFTFEYTEQAGGLLAGGYRSLTLDDELDSSKGYWVITTAPGKIIDVEGEYNSQMDAPLFIDSASGQNYGWNLVGMPFRFPVIWADTFAIDPIGNVLGLNQSDPIVAGGVIPGGSGTACSESALPIEPCKVAQFGFKFNEGTELYDILGPTSGSLNKFDAAWVFAGDSGYKLRFPMPVVERVTP